MTCLFTYVCVIQNGSEFTWTGESTAAMGRFWEIQLLTILAAYRAVGPVSPRISRFLPTGQQNAVGYLHPTPWVLDITMNSTITAFAHSGGFVWS